jgi:hypothetical protein
LEKKLHKIDVDIGALWTKINERIGINTILSRYDGVAHKGQQGRPMIKKRIQCIISLP